MSATFIEQELENKNRADHEFSAFVLEPKENSSPSVEDDTALIADQLSQPVTRPALAALPVEPAPPQQQQAWKSLLGGPEKPPLCTGREFLMRMH